MTAASQTQADFAEIQARVSGSSFYMAMLLMPKAERMAMFAIYGFCRLVDDIADDGTRPRPERAKALDRWRADIAALYAGKPAGQAGFLDSARRDFKLREADFLAVIDGMEMDVAADIRAPDLETLDLYCERVASAVGRLSIRIFGMDDKPGFALAHELGRALQLTNILRDIDEDAGLGRLYLPREALLHAGITSDDPNRVIAERALPKVCLPLAQRAKSHFEKSDEIMNRNKRRLVRAPRIMSKYYHSILDLLIARGFTAPREPVRVSKITRILILLRYALI